MKVVVNEKAREMVNKRNYSTVDLLKGKLYDVIAVVEKGQYYKRYRIIDESGEDYLYPASLFDIAEK